MEIDVNISLDGVFEEGFDFADYVRDEIATQVSTKIAQQLANEDLNKVQYHEEVKEAKKLYEKAAKDLQEKRVADINAVNEKISQVFDEFIQGKAIKLDRFGQPTEEVSVGDYIKDKVDEHVTDYQQTLNRIVREKVDKALKLSDYDLKKLVEHYTNEVRDENAKKVAEFILKGVK